MPSRNQQQQRPAGGAGKRRRNKQFDDDRTNNNNHGPSASPTTTTRSLVPKLHLVIGLAVALVAIFLKMVIQHFSSSNLPPIEPDPEVRMRNFLTWLQDNGAKISPKVTLALFPEFGGYGVQAKGAPVHKDDELFTIPSSLIIYPEHAMKRYILLFKEEIDKIAEKVFRSPLARQDFILALHLMVECSLGESSDMWPYLQMLPDYVPRLDTFDDEALGMLQDDYLASLARESKAELKTAWTKGHLESIITTTAELFNRQKRHKDMYKGCLTFESFHHYVTISSSRSMILEDGKKFLTPLADFMNHMPKYDASGEIMSEPFVQFHSRNEDGSITVRADRGVSQAGDQIFEAYGDRDNSLYLEAFGFVPDNNPFHCAIIPPEHIPRYNDIERMFNRASLGDMPEVCVYSDGAIASKEGRNLLAFVSADSVEGQAERCMDAFDFKGSDALYQECYNYTGSDDIVGAMTWALMVQVYCSASTTIDEDEALLRQLQVHRTKENAKKAVAIKFRLEEKKALLEVASLGEGQFSCDRVDKDTLRNIIGYI